jgi:hypothetical protein
MEIKLFDELEYFILSHEGKTDPVDNLQLLLRLPIIDKIRLVAFDVKVRQRN